MVFCLILNQTDSTVGEQNGKTLGFWEASHTCYAAVVVIVNIALLRLFNNWTAIGEVLIFFSIVSFWVSVLILSRFKFGTVLYRCWDQFVTSAPAWLGLFFVCTLAVTLDAMARYCVLWYQKGSLYKVFYQVTAGP